LLFSLIPNKYVNHASNSNAQIVKSVPGLPLHKHDLHCVLLQDCHPVWRVWKCELLWEGVSKEALEATQG